MTSFSHSHSFNAASAPCAKAVTSCARFVLRLDAMLVASIFVALVLVLALVLARALALLVLAGLLIMLALLLRGTSEYHLRAFGQARAY